MKPRPAIETYFDAMTAEWPFRGNRDKFAYYLTTLFEEVHFPNKRVLDIGGGRGIYSFYAACNGARDVVCLEPESDGSSSGVREKFRELQGLLRLNNVVLEEVTLQAFRPEGEAFDIVILHNSINHLNEPACIDLRRDESSRIAYKELFSKIHSMSSKGAKMIICDCSPYNVFPLLGRRNPFAPSIEWHKHQRPQVWASLLGEVGFGNSRILWFTPDRFRRLGRVLFSNEPMMYFWASHFRLTMDRL
jgi:SAM-dependent methyltransferase